MVNINWVSLYHPSRYMCASVSVAMMLFRDGHVVTVQELIAIVVVLILQVHRQVRVVE